MLGVFFYGCPLSGRVYLRCSRGVSIYPSAIMIQRDYAGLLQRHELSVETPRVVRNRAESMRRALDLLYGAFGSSGISWIGFYERTGKNEDSMVLVCREPKPACSPIGLFGMCGRGMLDRASIVIDDVRTLRGNYIACDPKDQSELVVPVIDANGNCDAVLDVDSYDLACFSEHDAKGMMDLMIALGLCPLNARSTSIKRL